MSDVNFHLGQFIKQQTLFLVWKQKPPAKPKSLNRKKDMNISDFHLEIRETWCSLQEDCAEDGLIGGTLSTMGTLVASKQEKNSV